MLLGLLSVARIQTVSASTTPFSKHIVFIIMENNPLSGITSTTAPYMHSLASTYANSTNYVGPVSSSWSPSLPNYIGLTSGSTQGITNDNGPSSNPVSAVNIIDKLDIAGVTFKFYMENMLSNCYTSDSGGYYVHHNPIPYYTDTNATSACSTLDVPAGSTSCPLGAASFSDITTCDSALINDLNSTSSTPSFMWLTPNHCNDMHDCSSPSCSSPSSTCVGVGDTYLSYLVKSILTTKTFEQDPVATIIITFDEPSSGTYGTTPVYFMVAGPGAKLHYASPSSNKYTHLNLLKTWESNWGLGCLVISTDCINTVVPMTEFFIPSFVMSTSPSSVSIFCNVFGCDPGHTVNSTLTITGVNGFNGLVTLSYIPPSNSVSGVYLTGQPTVNVQLGTPALLNVTAHGSGTTSGTFVWTINGSVQGFTINTTVRITYTWCAHCVLPP